MINVLVVNKAQSKAGHRQFEYWPAEGSKSWSKGKIKGASLERSKNKTMGVGLIQLFSSCSPCKPVFL